MNRGNEHHERVKQSFDEEWSRLYREGDQRALDGGVFEHYGRILRRLSGSFGRGIRALDVGCGTGRYFHCLSNVEHLVGTDLSAPMLEQAKTPIHADKITIGSIELQCGDLMSLPLAKDSFDLIYSIGVYGEYSPIDEALIEHCLRLLKLEGILFITAVDAWTRVSIPESDEPSFVRRVVRKSFPALPRWLRAGLNRRLSPFYVTQSDLEVLIRKARASRYRISRYVHTTGWLGTHLDCEVFK